MRIRLDELLKERRRSLYWLAQQTGIPYSTLHRYVSNEATGIRFAHLAAFCKVLDCTPNDLLQPKTKRRK